ncbi:peptide transporter [Herbaspirillum rubrisubalbicans]|uniref:Peptide transporter n=1 Tax=Herbaspirillum rubrisubalbicans TaxID=80842 RepID=A0ABX9C7G8_9BURK|nr:peptide transporter [Herbaspirillum rubrisubalbicans]RAM66883.1 peptide transporter [Herbaspirillum rubrisubalbicans]RAN47543.1 peptide transporter [Herbaspirillum rubrisubalbicans]
MTASQDDIFSLEKFEYLCYGRQQEAAARELVRLLMLIDRHYGQLAGNFSLQVSPAVTQAELEQHMLTRITSAISALLSDPSFHISPNGFGQLINFQRWLAALFGASHFINADHILRSLKLGGPQAEVFEVKPLDLVKFCLLYSPESELPLDVEALWAQNKPLAAALFLALLSPRFLGTPAAHSKREALLHWLPDRLQELDSLEGLPVGVLHDVYMHCSYADLPQRHRIKGAINQLILKKLQADGLGDLQHEGGGRVAGKPVMLVLLEWFSGGHSIYRTHSKTLEAARRHFHVVAMGYAANTDELGRAVFDEFITLDHPADLPGCLRTLRQTAQTLQPRVFYMPSVGMFPITMFAANLRVAPLQVAALGHPATTCSPRIDYISVEEDFVGDAACFTEALLRLPADGQPYRPSAIPFAVPRLERRDQAVVNVAIAATTMKLNPRFLAACQKIVELAAQAPQGVARQVRLHFLVGQAQGLLYPQLQRLILRYVPSAQVYAHQPYQQYLSLFNQCDMFLSPLPFGNTNGIIDAFTVGLPGVCKTGPEVFEHIDEGLFRRVGLPDWTIAATLDDYILAAVRMATDYPTRSALYAQLAQPQAMQRLFEGRPEALGDALAALCAAEPAQ